MDSVKASMKNKVEDLLKQSGAVLIRSKRHQVWRLSNGKTFVRSKTPSSRNTDKKIYADLRNLLGIRDETRGQAGQRRPKKTGGKRSEVFDYNRNVNTALADQLSLNGILEEALKQKIQILENQNKLLAEEVEKLCVFCRCEKLISVQLKSFLARLKRNFDSLPFLGKIF